MFLSFLFENWSDYVIWFILVFTICLTLFFQFRSYKITFVSNCDIEIKPIKQRTGSKIRLPEMPKRKGYFFEGWYLDPELEKRLALNETPLRKNMTLYAHWITLDEAKQLKKLK